MPMTISDYVVNRGSLQRHLKIDCFVMSRSRFLVQNKAFIYTCI